MLRFDCGRVLVTFDTVEATFSSRISEHGTGLLFTAPGTAPNTAGYTESLATSETGYSTFTDHSDF